MNVRTVFPFVAIAAVAGPCVVTAVSWRRQIVATDSFASTAAQAFADELARYDEVRVRLRGIPAVQYTNDVHLGRAHTLSPSVVEKLEQQHVVAQYALAPVVLTFGGTSDPDAPVLAELVDAESLPAALAATGRRNSVHVGHGLYLLSR